PSPCPTSWGSPRTGPGRRWRRPGSPSRASGRSTTTRWTAAGPSAPIRATARTWRAGTAALSWAPTHWRVRTCGAGRSTGRAGAGARGAREAAGPTVSGVREVYDDEVDRGRAVGTDPGHGSDVARGDGVTLLVSNALEVPDLRDMPLDEATDVLTDAGFTVVRESPVTDRRIADGHVVRTEPPAGGSVDPANPVLRIVPSDAISVPVVLGSRASDAQRTLREAGLTATIDTGTPDGIVYGQTPLPGRMVARGSEVEIDALG